MFSLERNALSKVPYRVLGWSPNYWIRNSRKQRKFFKNLWAFQIQDWSLKAVFILISCSLQGNYCCLIRNLTTSQKLNSSLLLRYTSLRNGELIRWKQLTESAVQHLMEQRILRHFNGWVSYPIRLNVFSKFLIGGRPTDRPPALIFFRLTFEDSFIELFVALKRNNTCELLSIKLKPLGTPPTNLSDILEGLI